jgi:23S rRNA (uracil1939-C5)-methyltransferase
MLDLYCGVGLFSLALAGQVGQVFAVESHPGAVADAQFNIEAANVDNIQVIEGDVGHVLADLERPIQAAVVDPPRSGCGAEVIKQLVSLRLERLVYVACDPATLARDAKILSSSGYRLEEIQPIDLFPQTYHIESVGLFLRDSPV